MSKIKELKELHGMDDVFADVFGDHVKVIANRKGFVVKDYEHE
jgi:hypothetical protein